jgi:hypothetical protein
MAQGKIQDGDAIGDIWLEDDYDANGLRGRSTSRSATTCSCARPR